MYEGNNNHKDSLQIGLEFQDFIAKEFLYKLGISITTFNSKKYQFNEGENLQGIEIKYDARSTGDCTYYNCKPTGNVAVEVREKTKKEHSTFINSGILRNDNTFLYVIGNYQNAWVFGKNHLQTIFYSNKYKLVQTLPTMQCILLPIEDADKYCIKKLIF